MERRNIGKAESVVSLPNANHNANRNLSAAATIAVETVYTFSVGHLDILSTSEGGALLLGIGLLSIFRSLDALALVLQQLLLLVASLLGKELHATKGLSIRVQLDHGTQILERVLLVHHAEELRGLSRLELRLDLVGVDDTSEVSVDHGGEWELVAILLLGGTTESAEDLVELGEGTLGPHAETAKVATGSKLQQVEA